ncbi:hypothetical protein CI610_01855 [invertebrate metagenome]|uniref:RING-type domain-containing protein n=1 Tax=invertebrate metagenome TaxID=1711999 RepID=A0A2H9T7H0_9ZZZZ
MRYRLMSINKIFYLTVTVLCVSSSHSETEYIAGLPVQVITKESVCPVCYDVPTSPNYVAQPDCCSHAACKNCLDQIKEKIKPAHCPSCIKQFRSFRQSDKEMSWGQLKCPGCSSIFSREEIEGHLEQCQHNQSLYDQENERSKKEYMNYVMRKTEEKNQPLSIDGKFSLEESVSKISLFYSGNKDSTYEPAGRSLLPEAQPKERGSIYTPLGESHLSGVQSGNDVSFYYHHNLFWQLDHPASIGTVQMTGHEGDIKTSRQLLCASSMCGIYKSQLPECPREISQYFSGGKPSDDEISFHTVVAVQQETAPLTLSVLLPKPIHDKSKWFLIYGVDIPNQPIYWNIQQRDSGGVLLEASSENRLISAPKISREEEAAFERTTGTSIRSNKSNSVRFILLIAYDPHYKLPEEAYHTYFNRQENTPYLHHMPAMHPEYLLHTAYYKWTARGTNRRTDSNIELDRTVSDGIENARCFQQTDLPNLNNSFDDIEIDSPPQTTLATQKHLSDYRLPTDEIASAVHRVCPGSLIIKGVAVVFLDVVHIDYYATQQQIELDKNIQREVAQQQQKLHEAIEQH